MITFDYTKSELKSIQRGLYALKAGDIPLRNYGICANLDERANLDLDYFLQPCFATWKHFSGNCSYPVPSPYSDEHPASDVYETTHEDDMWNPEHPYGSLRLDLLEHLIRECEDAIDNGGCSECAFHRVGNCSHYDCSGGVFKLIGVVEELKEEE